MNDLDSWARRAEPHVLMVPGIDNSGPGHWQTLWEAEGPWFSRAELGMWERPRRNAWVTNLGHAIRAARAPVILCAHSLGCLAVAWWAAFERPAFGDPVAGALLVAPPDCDRADVDPRLANFGPTPSVDLPFPAILVASRDDRHASIERSRRMAEQWGAVFHDIGALGHINAQSALGSWPEGRMLLHRIADSCVAPAPGRRRASVGRPRAHRVPFEPRPGR